MTSPSVSDIAVKALAFGVAGWALENVLFGERYSAVWSGAKVPFLPVYAFGGAAIALAAPHLKASNVPMAARAALYAGALSGIEYAGCQIDRRTFKACSWDYSNQLCKVPAEGCVDLEHAGLWGVLGLLVETL
jgi:uncharacterized membrane protein